MRFFSKIILFLTLAISTQLSITQADEDLPSEEILTCLREGSPTLLQDINSKINTLEEDGLTVFSSDNKTLLISQDDIYLMAQIVYSESKGEPYNGKVAVASVILNRVMDSKFPNSIKEVIFQPKAFSCVLNGEINVIPNNDCYNSVYDAISGVDPTNDALFFYNPAIATCSWMKNIDKEDITEIGNHLFFKVN